VEGCDFAFNKKKNGNINNTILKGRIALVGISELAAKKGTGLVK
jgi:hypothetical protein